MKFVFLLLLIACEGSWKIGETDLPPLIETTSNNYEAFEGIRKTITLPSSSTGQVDSCKLSSNEIEVTTCICSSNKCTAQVLAPIGTNGIFKMSFWLTNEAGTSEVSTFNIRVRPAIAFTSIWRVGDLSYGDGDNSVTLPIPTNAFINVVIDWGDNSISRITSATDPELTHNYTSPGDYTIQVKGELDSWAFNNLGDKDKILEVLEFGRLGWVNLSGGFQGATNLTTFEGGDFSKVTSIAVFFGAASKVTPNTTNWDTSNVESMVATFSGATMANPDTSNWNTSKVTSMNSMFGSASNANPNTTNFDTSKVVSFAYMFLNAGSARPDTSNWDTSSATSFMHMFRNAPNATPEVSRWNTSKVTNMNGVFYGLTSADPDVSNWDTSKVKTFQEMFRGATSANPDVSSWDTSSATNLQGVFMGATSASPDVSNWNVSKVTNMNNLFRASGASVDLSGWNFTSVTSMTSMFFGTTQPTAKYSANLIRIEATCPATSMSFGGGNSKYDISAAGARSNLVSRG